jgi:hypothetical protein
MSVRYSTKVAAKFVDRLDWKQIAIIYSDDLAASDYAASVIYELEELNIKITNDPDKRAAY